MKKLLCMFLVSLLCLGSTAFAENTYQVIADQGADSFAENGVTLAELRAAFPQVTGLSNTEAMDRINRAIQDHIRLDGGYDGVCEAALGDYQAGYLDPSQGAYFLSVEAEAKLAGRNILSVLFDFAAYQGGAHPDHWSTAKHFDLGTGDEVTLEMLVKDADAFHGAVVGLLLAQMKARDLSKKNDYFEEYVEYVGQWRTEQAVFTPDGLLVFFNPYDIAPYSSGSQLLTIPYADLSGYWSEMGVALLSK